MLTTVSNRGQSSLLEPFRESTIREYIACTDAALMFRRASTGTLEGFYFKVPLMEEFLAART